MSLISEFKNFIAKGNAFDLAVGVIAGAAFAPIVKSMVEDIIMPIISIPLGAVDFKNLYLPLSGKGIALLRESILAHTPVLPLEEAKKLGSVISYGNLLNALVTFFFTMLGVFLLVKVVNILKRKEEAKPSAAPEPSREAILLTEIRDALVAKKE
ncbi:MAG: large conductance mechanosensitive channel protein MscL [Chthoniobacterales bacterium]